MDDFLYEKLRVLLCGVQVPFVWGGAETLLQSLEENLRRVGHLVEAVKIPFKWYPKSQLFNQCLIWRLLDLNESMGEPIDLLIATKFPSYLVKHPHKVVWLVHQHREIYDRYGGKFSSFSNSIPDNQMREKLIKMDTEALQESKRVFAISGNVQRRCQKFNGVDSQLLYPPLSHPERYYHQEYGDYILSVCRLEEDKRVDLLLKALSHGDDMVKAFIVGQGSKEEELKQLAFLLDLTDRVEFLGWVEKERLYQLYAGCMGIFYSPMDEDFGLVTLEAFQSKKPVITCQDSGGTLEFVFDGVSGFVTAPDPHQISERIDQLYSDRALCQKMGEEGYQRVKGITWDKTLSQLLQG